MKGQSWKSSGGDRRVPGIDPDIYPEHELFIQLINLKGEELITHLGIEYYD